jgi:hypothetical protein
MKYALLAIRLGRKLVLDMRMIPENCLTALLKIKKEMEAGSVLNHPKEHWTAGRLLRRLLLFQNPSEQGGSATRLREAQNSICSEGFSMTVRRNTFLGFGSTIHHYYYDVLVGLDGITRLGYGHDNRLRPALEILKKRQDDETWILEKAHSDLGAGAHHRLPKKVRRFALEEADKPSKWITLTALRVLKRIEDQSQ